MWMFYTRRRFELPPSRLTQPRGLICEQLHPVYELSLPDYASIGPKNRPMHGDEFPGSRLALRFIFLDDHPDLSRDGLVPPSESWGPTRTARADTTAGTQGSALRSMQWSAK